VKNSPSERGVDLPKRVARNTIVRLEANLKPQRKTRTALGISLFALVLRAGKANVVELLVAVGDAVE
jgi:hypothetical protein